MTSRAAGIESWRKPAVAVSMRTRIGCWPGSRVARPGRGRRLAGRTGREQQCDAVSRMPVRMICGSWRGLKDPAYVNILRQHPDQDHEPNDRIPTARSPSSSTCAKARRPSRPASPPAVRARPGPCARTVSSRGRSGAGRRRREGRAARPGQRDAADEDVARLANGGDRRRPPHQRLTDFAFDQGHLPEPAGAFSRRFPRRPRRGPGPPDPSVHAAPA